MRHYARLFFLATLAVESYGCELCSAAQLSRDDRRHDCHALLADVFPGRVIASDAATEVQVASYLRLAIAKLAELEIGRPVEFDHPSVGMHTNCTLIKLGTRAAGGVGRCPRSMPTYTRPPAVEVLKRRVDESGMFVVHQDIYLRGQMGSDFADIVLPAATWGEEDFTRCNGERRLRLYSKFCDAPGDAKPDWWIIAQFAKRMGFKDYDWKDSNDVFEQAVRFGRMGVLNYHPLVVYAKQLGKKGHELLRELGTHGIQTPIRYRETLTEPDDYKQYVGYYDDPNVAGAIIGTKRLHDPEMDYGVPEGPTVHTPWLSAFGSHTGKALLHKTPWDLFSDFYDRILPNQCGSTLRVVNAVGNTQHQGKCVRVGGKMQMISRLHPGSFKLTTRANLLRYPSAEAMLLYLRIRYDA